MGVYFWRGEPSMVNRPFLIFGCHWICPLKSESYCQHSKNVLSGPLQCACIFTSMHISLCLCPYIIFVTYTTYEICREKSIMWINGWFKKIIKSVSILCVCVFCVHAFASVFLHPYCMSVCLRPCIWVCISASILCVCVSSSMRLSLCVCVHIVCLCVCVHIVCLRIPSASPSPSSFLRQVIVFTTMAAIGRYHKIIHRIKHCSSDELGTLYFFLETYVQKINIVSLHWFTLHLIKCWGIKFLYHWRSRELQRMWYQPPWFDLNSRHIHQIMASCVRTVAWKPW